MWESNFESDDLLFEHEFTSHLELHNSKKIPKPALALDVSV